MSTEPDGTSRASAASVLAGRARLLARRPDGRDAAATMDVVEFELAGARYAVETACVREVLPLRRFTPLPSLPPHVLGIMNVRGRIWPILDTKVLLGLPGGRLPAKPRVVLLESPEMEFGLAVDLILGARRIPRADLVTPAGALSRGKTEYLLAVTSAGIAVLDARRMLADPALVVRDGPEA